MVECLAYNEKVGGSSPLLFNFLKNFSPYRLTVRTLLFHGNNMGSNPIRDKIKACLSNKKQGEVAEWFIAEIC
jgi:hypothetical protein